MKEKMDGNISSHKVTVFLFIVFVVLGLACATKPKNLDELTTYSKTIEVNDLSQQELFVKVKTYFDNTFKGDRNFSILSSNQNTGIINCKLAVDGIIYGEQRQRYNSIFKVEVGDGNFKITFSEPTIQNIGYVSEYAKEKDFQAYLVGYKGTSSALNPLTNKLPLPSNSNINKTDAEIRAEWEKKNVFSSTNPGPSSPVRYDYQVKNIREQWDRITNELKAGVAFK